MKKIEITVWVMDDKPVPVELVEEMEKILERAGKRAIAKADTYKIGAMHTHARLSDEK